jgi:hypothetical protein
MLITLSNISKFWESSKVTPAKRLSKMKITSIFFWEGLNFEIPAMKNIIEKYPRLAKNFLKNKRDTTDEKNGKSKKAKSQTLLKIPAVPKKRNAVFTSDLISNVIKTRIKDIPKLTPTVNGRKMLIRKYKNANLPASE